MKRTYGTKVQEQGVQYLVPVELEDLVPVELEDLVPVEPEDSRLWMFIRIRKVLRKLERTLSPNLLELENSPRDT